ncbi:hypothetical protein [Duganella levis]|uniref:Uncharacterized protein n=1 Tax=Duganella levis TaxID=2692169 RepID=A0ABW9VT72_9BURK|nr:hypothetical protein [Duganella levis]MYN24832.1 hypothetical protein [Duganella levis]
MPNVSHAHYVPIATNRNKLVFKELTVGVRALIDVENIYPPHDREVWHTWLCTDDSEDSSGTFWYQDDGKGKPQRLGSADEMRTSATHGKARESTDSAN